MNNCLVKLASILCTIGIFIQLCKSLNVIDLPYESERKPIAEPRKLKHSDQRTARANLEEYKYVPEPIKFAEFKSETVPMKPIRKYWLLNEQAQHMNGQIQPRGYEDEKDENLKQKIANLVDQTMRDTHKKMKQTEEIQGENRDESPYKVGFILCMIKKSKNVMDELFNVAVKHKEQWKSLQHLKVFELIAHTNIDTTNLLRQLVNVHLKKMTQGSHARNDENHDDTHQQHDNKKKHKI